MSSSGYGPAQGIVDTIKDWASMPQNFLDRVSNLEGEAVDKARGLVGMAPRQAAPMPVTARPSWEADPADVERANESFRQLAAKQQQLHQMHMPLKAK